MRGRDAKGTTSADLLVCFPSRAHLALMPKPICSPSRPSESNKRQNTQNMKKISNKGGKMHASPLMWAKTKRIDSDISEPTSPKVTCAGQIKIRHKGQSCKSWQSVMEEIEKMHNRKKKRPSWGEALGFKKEIMQFLTCLRNIRLDFRCFGAFPTTEITSDDDDEDDEEDNDNEEYQESENDEASKAVFSKWLMVLQENNDKNSESFKEEKRWSCDDECVGAPAVPPPNALLLMRCKSAPAKSWLKEQHQNCDNKEKTKGRELKLLMEEEKKEEEEERRKKEESENIVLMNYDTEYYNISTDIAKETWIVGDMKDTLSRTRSSRR